MQKLKYYLGRTKVQLGIVIGLLVFAVVVLPVFGLVILIKNGGSGANQSSTSQVLKDGPAMVGQYRYINACQTVPTSQYQEIFGYAKSDYTNSVDIHAEGSHTKRIVTNSSCTTTFGYVPPVNNDPLTQGDRGRMVTLIDQYTDVDTANQTFTTEAGNTFSFTQSTVGNVKVAFSKTLATRFEFLYKNAIVSVDVSPTTYYRGNDKLVITPDYTAGVAKKLVPIITASIDNKNLSQAPLKSPDSGKQMNGVGSAVVINPCEAFTSDDFKAVINGDEDNTEVGSLVPNNPIAHGAKVQQLANGRDQTSCTRKGYISTPQPSGNYATDPQGYLAKQKAYAAIVSPSMTATYQFYNSSSEAVSGGNEKVAGAKLSYVDLKTTPVNGVGERALLLDYHLVGQDAGASEYNNPKNHEVHLYVVKGAYLIDIQLTYAPGAATTDQSAGHEGSLEQYTKAGQLLAARLAS